MQSTDMNVQQVLTEPFHTAILPRDTPCSGGGAAGPPRLHARTLILKDAPEGLPTTPSPLGSWLTAERTVRMKPRVY